MAESSPRNCIRSSEKYWIANPIDLFLHFTLFPSASMSIESKLNSLMRLCLIVFAVLIAVGYHFAVLFLALATAINVIFYFACRGAYQ